MKSTTFRNLVLGFYTCVGFLLFYIVDFTLERNYKYLETSLIQISLPTHEVLSFFVMLPFFIGIFISLFYKKAIIISAFYFTILFSLALILKTNLNSEDSIVSLILFFTIVIFLICFSQHASFYQSNSISKNSDTILDNFVENYQNREIEPYFLRVHRIFSFALTSVGIGIISLSTQTGGHISVDEGLGLTFLGFVFVGFAGFLWKFPKVASWITALTCLGMFILGEMLFFEENIWNAIQNVNDNLNWIKMISILIFGFSFLFLAFIVVSKTAREEWKNDLKINNSTYCNLEKNSIFFD